jgi:ABC-type glycerol-3-phosphate transport system substrate-binding protein
VQLDATNKPSETKMNVALGSSLSVNAKTKYPAQAKDFIAFLMDPKNDSDYAVASSQPPALINKYYQPDDGTKLAVKFIKAGKSVGAPDQLFPNPDVRNAWVVTVQDLIGGSATPADVLKAMDASWSGK